MLYYTGMSDENWIALCCFSSGLIYCKANRKQYAISLTYGVLEYAGDVSCIGILFEMVVSKFITDF